MRAQHERSVPEVVQDIIGNLQEILRSEFQLAKTEIKEDAAEAAKPIVRLGVGLDVKLPRFQTEHGSELGSQSGPALF